MSSTKKDLTRIEDLDDFIHEDNLTGQISSVDAETPPELPDSGDSLGIDALENSQESTQASFRALPSEEDLAFPDVSADAPSFSDSHDFGETPSFGETPTFTPEDNLASLDEAEFGSDAFNSTSAAAPAAAETNDTVDNNADDLSFSMGTDAGGLSDLTANLKTNAPRAQETKAILSEVISLADKREEKAEEKSQEQAPSPRITPDDMPYRPREDFAEVRSFAEKAVLADVTAECNPAYSVIAHGVKFLEDSDDILLVLRELKFPEDLMQQFQRQLERGSLLVPRVSEFTAIYLCHRLRRFRLELQMAPSDLLHPPRSDSEASQGLVSRRSLGQNQHHQFQFDETQDAKNILLSTLAHLDGHVIERYLGVATESSFLDGHEVEGDTTAAINARYDELAQKLKGHALEHKANAVVGINYQLTPMPGDGATGPGHYRYKLTCTGNLVRVSRPHV